MITIQILYTVRHVPEGWIARADEVGATAQGATEEEAIDNLRALLDDPDLLDPLFEAARKAPTEHLELVAV